jgi:hypothetical protein
MRFELGLLADNARHRAEVAYPARAISPRCSSPDWSQFATQLADHERGLVDAADCLCHGLSMTRQGSGKFPIKQIGAGSLSFSAKLG